jgi:hypothetical protein
MLGMASLRWPLDAVRRAPVSAPFLYIRIFEYQGARDDIGRSADPD